ncbi:MAG: hypothetical protein AABX99_04450 [Nanoarchaeota archaeon]
MKEEKQKVYCQTCGTDLTDEGAYVSSEGRIFCYDLLRPRLTCGDVAAKHSLITIRFSYKLPEDIQKEIADGKITNFGCLEKKTFD